MVKGVVFGLLGVLLVPFWFKAVSSSSVAANEYSIRSAYSPTNYRPEENNLKTDLLKTNNNNSNETSIGLPESVGNRLSAIAKAVQNPNPQELLTAIFPQPELETLLSYSPQSLANQQAVEAAIQKAKSIETQKSLSDPNQQLPKFDRDLLFPKTANPSDLKFSHPAPATERVASVFGWRVRPFSRRWQMHNGIDYGAPLGSTVVAVEDGIVTKVVSGCLDFRQRWCGNQYGNWVQIDHGNGVVTTYGHLLNGSIAVKEGARVWQNQEIAEVGSSGWSTGAHLDFRVEIAGQYQDPAIYIKGE